MPGICGLVDVKLLCQQNGSGDYQSVAEEEALISRSAALSSLPPLRCGFHCNPSSDNLPVSRSNEIWICAQFQKSEEERMPVIFDQRRFMCAQKALAP